MKIKRILVPVDFSATSLAALDAAIDLSRALDASLEILCVVEPFVYAPLAGPAVDLSAIRVRQERIARRRLGALERRLAKRRVRCRAELRLGNPYRTIVERATKLPAELVVMGTQGRSGLSHLLLGSVAERVVRSAPCPVLTVRARPKAARRRPKKR
ncbi:MAG: universal stress protein [Deltaproteobacteria bacterium]|nr:universal stress protein [Deltaproteobacteria bacterium]